MMEPVRKGTGHLGRQNRPRVAAKIDKKRTEIEIDHTSLKKYTLSLFRDTRKQEGREGGLCLTLRNKSV